jgi:hypothetical protein
MCIRCQTGMDVSTYFATLGRRNRTAEVCLKLSRFLHQLEIQRDQRVLIGSFAAFRMITSNTLIKA